METKPDKIFAKGIYFDKPREGAPEFIRGRISIKVVDAIPFLEMFQSNAGYVNLDLKKSKEGKLYLELNQFVPKAKVQEKVEVVEDHTAIDPTTGIDLADRDLIPF